MTALARSNANTKAQKFLGLLIFGAVFCLAANTASAQSNREIDNRLRRIENEIDTLSRALYKGETPPPGAFSGGGTSNADIEVRIQGFESQIRMMTGKLEEQDYQIRQLREQLEKLNADLDVRLNNNSGSTGGGFGAPSSSGGGFNNNPIKNGTVNGNGAMQYQNRSQEMPPQPDSSSGYQWKSGSAETGGQLGTLTENDSGVVANGDDSAATIYENAFSQLKGAQYDEAEKGFMNFLNQYPKHPLTGNATYWLGETYYVRGQFEKAAKTFAQGYQKDPKGGKAADNLLKMGMSLSGMGKKTDACVALAQINKEFAASAGPVLHRAEQEMTRLGC